MDYTEAIKASRCFGLAYDSSVKECKVCEVCKLCKQKTEGIIPAKEDLPDNTNPVDTEVKATKRPEPKEQSKPVKPAKKAKQNAGKTYSDDMPDFKPMSIDDIINLASERGVNVSEYDKYTATNIKRMRLIMAIKATYEV
jgi:hypothetical protein